MRLKIKEFCLMRNISMRELGRKINMKICMLSRINTGKETATIVTLDKIAEALETDYNSLIDKEYYSGIKENIEIFSDFQEVDSSKLELSALKRVQLADEKGREVLERLGRINEKGIEIRQCF